MGMERTMAPPHQVTNVARKNGVKMEHLDLIQAELPDLTMASVGKKPKSGEFMKQLLKSQQQVINDLHKQLVEKEKQNLVLRDQIDSLQRRLERSDRRSTVTVVEPSPPKIVASLPRKRRRRQSTSVTQDTRRTRTASETEGPSKQKRKSSEHEITVVESPVAAFEPASTVVVPSFRVKTFHPLSQTHTDEVLTDDAYMRRHLKHEKHERQIVRRDRIRQREEMMRERLQASARSTGNKPSAQSQQQAGQLDMITSIEICKRLPKSVLRHKECDPLHRTRDSARS